jgi:iron complex outermembrane receptor protein
MPARVTKNGAEMISLKSGLMAGGLFMCAAPAFAQTTTAAPTPAQPAVQTASIAEVVVTAERHETSAQKAPLTIQVLGGDQIGQAGLSTVADLSRLTTGVDIGNGGSGVQIFIRGVGDFSFTPLANPGVAFNVDGVYVGRPDGIGGNFYDVARVEVLKGPQGTLYGRNANGGSINVITNEPRLGQTGGDINIEAGNYDLMHVDGAFNVPVGDTAALRAAYNVITRSGYMSDGAGDDVQQDARLRFRWDPSGNLKVLLNADYDHIGGKGSGFTYLAQRPGSSAWEGTADPRAIAYRSAMPPLGPLLDRSAQDPRQETRLYNLSAQVDWKLRFATLTVLPAYRNYDVFSSSVPGFLYTQPNKGDQKSLEVRLGNSAPILTWVVGGYVFGEDGNGSTRATQSAIIQDSQRYYHPRTTAYAGFGQGALKVLDNLRLIIGGRYTLEQRSLDGLYIDMRPVPFGPGPGTVLERFSGRKDFSGLTYKAGLEYDLSPRNMIFFTASSGFKAGGINQTVGPNNIFNPEKLDALEFGSKNRFFDNRLQVNVGLYRWKYNGLQDQRVTFDPLGLINLLFFNVGDATIQGATADLVAKPTAADTFTVSAEYADSHYDSFRAQVPTAVFLPGSIGCPTSRQGPNTVANCAGYQVARVPQWTGSASYDHVFTLASGATVDLGGSLKFATSRWLATDFIPSERAAGYAVGDATLTYTVADRRYSIGAFVRNIGNTAYYTGNFEQPFVPGLFAASVSAPRTFGARLKVYFGER